MISNIELPNQDGKQLTGTWYMPSTEILGAVLCLHAFPDNRQVWEVWQQEWIQDGIASLAIDLPEPEESLKAVFTAIAWLKTQTTKPIALIGASIGANLAIQALAADPSLRGVIMLSPGLDYHGITTMDAMRKLQPDQAVWLIASEGDDQASADTVQQLAASVEGPYIQLELLTHAGHGTDILKMHPELLTQSCQWFQDLLSS